MHFQAIIMDGKDGEVVWSLQTAKYEMTSDLVARTLSRRPSRDAFIFRVRGREEPVGDADSLSHGVIKQDGDPVC